MRISSLLAWVLVRFATGSDQAGGKVGREETGGQCIDTDVVREQSVGKALHQMMDGGFRYPVTAENRGIAEIASNTTGDDDLALSTGAVTLLVASIQQL